MSEWMICALCGNSQEDDPNGATWLMGTSGGRLGDNGRNIHQSCAIDFLVDMKMAWEDALEEGEE